MPEIMKWGKVRLCVDGQDLGEAVKTGLDGLQPVQASGDPLGPGLSLEARGKMECPVQLIFEPFDFDRRLQRVFFRLPPDRELFYLCVRWQYRKKYASRAAMRILRKRNRR